MPPENTQLKQTTEAQTEEQQEQASKEAETEFSSGFKKVRGDKLADDKGDKEEKDDEPAKAAAPAAATPEAAAPAADEWEGVSPAVRKRLESIDAMATRVRNVEGHIGGLNSTIKQLSNAGKAAAEDKGAAAPTDAQVATAAEDDAEWAKLREDYPEWAGGIDRQMAVIEKRILQKSQPQVDVGALRNELSAESAKQREEIRAEIREEMRVERKHPDYLDTINTPAFLEWFKAQPPVVQALSDSPRSKDAISLLDSYTEHKAAQAASTETPAEQSRREKTDKRLKAATVPKGSQQPPPPSAISDDEAFTRGFKKTRKA